MNISTCSASAQGREHGRRVFLIAVLAAGCGADVGPAQPWIPVDEIPPPLQVEASSQLAGKAAPAASPSSVRVVTYNVAEADPEMTPEKLAAGIQGNADLASADVLLVQEEESHASESRSRAAQLAELLGMDHVYVPARTTYTGTHGLAIFSVYPIEHAEKMDLPLTRGRPRIAVSADIVVADRVLHVVDLHLDPSLNSTERLAQLRPAVIDAPANVLVAGDFNTNWLEFIAAGVPVLSASSATDQTVVVDSYMAALGFDSVSSGSGSTAFLAGYEARLDSIYARGLEVTFGRVERVGPSDHWPLWADVALR